MSGVCCYDRLVQVLSGHFMLSLICQFSSGYDLLFQVRSR